MHHNISLPLINKRKIEEDEGKIQYLSMSKSNQAKMAIGRKNPAL